LRRATSSAPTWWGSSSLNTPALAHAARDELGVLPAVVEDDDLVDARGTSSGALSSASSVPPSQR
jgi:hypothetical protein